MLKDLKNVAACFSLGISLLFAFTVTAGQTKISLERDRNKKTGQTESVATKASKPTQTNDSNAPALVPPDVQGGTSVAESTEAANQSATQSTAEAPSPAPPWNFNLLTLNDVFPAVLVNSGVPKWYEMPFGPSPFAPSNARTTTGQLIVQKDFIPAKRCAKCHGSLTA